MADQSKTMTMIRSLVLSSALLVAGHAAVADPIAGLWNTGVNDLGGLNAVGTAESHYATDSFDGFSFSVVDRPSAWVTNPNDAQWIGPSRAVADSLLANTKWIGLSNDPVATYNYSLSFTLETFAAAELHGWWASDNCGRILLNGNEVAALGKSDFKSLHEFAITDLSFFKIGTNLLTFEVVNAPGTEGVIDPKTGTYYTYGNPSGLIVSGLNGSYDRVPDGGLTAALLGLGLLGLVAVRRRSA